MSLRHQLRNTSVKVIELIPPYVATELGGAGKPALNFARPPMPLDAFITETMKELESEADEVAIADATRLVSGSREESLLPHE